MKYITVFVEYKLGSETKEAVAGFTFPRPITHKEFFNMARHMLRRNDTLQVTHIDIRSGGFVDSDGNTHGVSKSLGVKSLEGDKEIINAQYTGIFYPMEFVE